MSQGRGKKLPKQHIVQCTQTYGIVKAGQYFAEAESVIQLHNIGNLISVYKRVKQSYFLDRTQDGPQLCSSRCDPFPHNRRGKLHHLGRDHGGDRASQVREQDVAKRS